MKKVAESVLHKRRVEIAENRYLDVRKVPKYTFADLVKRYSQWADNHHRDQRGIRSRVKALACYFGNERLDQITAQEIEGFIKQRLLNVNRRQ